MGIWIGCNRLTLERLKKIEVPGGKRYGAATYVLTEPVTFEQQLEMIAIEIVIAFDQVDENVQFSNEPSDAFLRKAQCVRVVQGLHSA